MSDVDKRIAASREKDQKTKHLGMLLELSPVGMDSLKITCSVFFDVFFSTRGSSMLAT